MIKKITFLTFFAVGLLSSCASNKVELMDRIDSSEKTISVPAGSLAVLGPVKQKLVVNGWEVDEFDQIDTRYKLSVNTVRTQLLCLNEWSELNYEILLMDKKNRKQVFRISGASCDSYSDVGEAFEKALKAAESTSKER